MANKKDQNRERRHAKIRAKIKGTPNRPRLVVFRSLRYTYAQIVDDENGVVLASSSDIKETKGTKVEKAKSIGLELAKKAKEKKIETVVFDRNGYKYHGRTKAIADGAREGGLNF